MRKGGERGGGKVCEGEERRVEGVWGGRRRGEEEGRVCEGGGERGGNTETGGRKEVRGWDIVRGQSGSLVGVHPLRLTGSRYILSTVTVTVTGGGGTWWGPESRNQVPLVDAFESMPSLKRG